MDDCACWWCSHPGMTAEAYREHLRGIIDRRGWAVQSVLGTRTRAPFSYTVGLTGRGLPELVLTGREWQDAGPVLHGAAQYTVDEVEVRAGEVMHLGELHLEAVEVEHPEAHLLAAVALYGPGVRAVQMVWADERGRLPWERGHRGGRGGQPVLGRRSSPWRGTG